MPSTEKTKKQSSPPPSPETTDDHRDFLDIDLLSLEEEWAGQGNLANKWHRKLARANTALEIAEAEFELLQARLDKDIRENQEAYEIPKVTETAVAKTIIMQKEYQVAQKACIDARLKVNLIKATTIGVEHKKKGLEKEVDLFGMQYFSVPRSNERTKEVISNIEKKAVRRRE